MTDPGFYSRLKNEPKCLPMNSDFRLKKKIEMRCVRDLQRNQCFMNCVWDKKEKIKEIYKSIKTSCKSECVIVILYLHP